MKALRLKNGGYADGKPKSYALTDLKSIVELGELPEPEPKPGQVRIKVALASVNPSDEMFIQGYYGQPRIAGNAPGFEGVGHVSAGNGKPGKDMIGQRVAFVAAPGCPGSWSQYSISSAASCIPLMDGVSDADGAAMIVNPLTAMAMFDIVRHSGSRAFFMTAGASQLGKLIIGLARDEGYEAIAVVRRDSQIESLKKLGAAHVLNSKSDTFETDMRELAKTLKPKIFLDALGNQTSAKIFDAMPINSRWVIYGKLDEELPTIMQPGQMIFQSKHIEGFWLTNWLARTPPDERNRTIHEAQQRFVDGLWHTDVTAIVPIEEAIERLPEELAKPDGKVFIKP